MLLMIHFLTFFIEHVPVIAIHKLIRFDEM